MKVYIAASFKNREGAKAWKDGLEAKGMTITSRWIENHLEDLDPLTDVQRAQEAVHDLEDIDAADVLLFLNTPEIPSTSGGQHLEMGYALAKGKPVYLVGPQTSVFHFHPGITKGGNDVTI